MKRIDKMYNRVLTAINTGAYYHGLWLGNKNDENVQEYYYKEWRNYENEAHTYIDIIVDVFDVAAVDVLQCVKTKIDETFINDKNRQAVYENVFNYSKGYYKF